MPFMDMFQKESVKVDACKTIMEAFNRYAYSEFYSFHSYLLLPD